MRPAPLLLTTIVAFIGCGDADVKTTADGARESSQATTSGADRADGGESEYRGPTDLLAQPPAWELGETVTLTDANFRSKVLESPLPVLVDFWGPDCPPCVEMAPIIRELARDYKGRAVVGKLNVRRHERMGIEYAEEAIPVFIVFLNGKPHYQAVGSQPKERLAKAVDAAIAETVK